MNYFDLFLEEEDHQIIKTFRDFVEQEIMSVRNTIDDDAEHETVKRIRQGLVKLGLQRAPFPEKYGGSNLNSALTLAIIHEELGRGDSGIGCSSTVTAWAWLPALVAGNKTLMDKFAPMFCGDEVKIGCFCMTEPGGAHGGGGCDIENPTLEGRKIATTARLDGDEWVINGQKMWTSNSGVADLYCVVCTTDPELGEEGIAMIYVPSPSEGLTFGPFEKMAGFSGDRNCPVYFDNVRVPKEYRAAGPGKDAELFRNNLIVGRIVTAGLAVGNAQSAFETVLKYTGERIVADKPIRQHSIAANILADMAIGIETARHAYLTAAYMYDRPAKYGSPLSDFMLSRASLAKMHACDVAVSVTNKAMELMGSYGYSRDGNVEKYWRDCKIIQLFVGGAQLGRFDICRGYYDCKL